MVDEKKPASAKPAEKHVKKLSTEKSAANKPAEKPAKTKAARMSAPVYTIPCKSYKVMTIEAVTALKSRRGVSLQAIYKYIGHKYTIGFTHYYY